MSERASIPIPESSRTKYSNAVSVAAGSRPTAGRWTARVAYELYDATRGGAVWVYRDIYLVSNGSTMRAHFSVVFGAGMW